MLPRFHILPALLVALVAGVFVYGALFLRATPLERDDDSLVTPLTSVASPASYFAAWRAGHILDVAPVRDATFAFDLAASRALGRPTFTLVNFILWLVFVALALLLGRAIGLGDGALWLLLLLLCAHPVYAVSVAWISSRKHLLAGVFILAATLVVARPPKRGAGPLAAALYALSLLSNPIHLLWPVFAWVFRRGFPLRQSWLAFALLGALNTWYYAGPYRAATGLGKFSAEGGPGVALLAFGRAAFDLILPVSLSPVDYAPWAPGNFAGIFVLVVLALLCWRLLPRTTWLPWALFTLLPLVLLNVRSTRVFLSDTYLLVPSLGLWILLLLAIQQRKLDLRAITVGALILACGGLFATRALASSFESMESLFALAYEREPTPQVAAVHAKHLFESGRLREAAELSFGAIQDFPAAEIVFAQAVAVDPALSNEQKLALLAKAPGREPVFHYFVARTLAASGRIPEAWREIQPALTDLAAFGPFAPTAAKDALTWAARSGALTPALEASVSSQLRTLGGSAR